MIQRIAELLRDEIDDLVFVERTAGLVRALPITVPAEDGVVTKVMPVAISTGLDCEPQDMMYLTPDSDVMSIVFFEDGGTTIERRDSFFLHCRSTVRMIAWFNLRMINPDYEDATLLMAHLVSAVPKYLDDDDFIVAIKVEPLNELPKETVYSAYDLNLEENLYFAFPYDYGAFEFDVMYRIPPNCLDAVVIDPDVCI